MNIQLENIYKNKTKNRRFHPTIETVGFLAYCRKNIENPNRLKIFLIFNLATLLIYFSGFSVLIPLIGLKKAFLTGMLPFLLPDLLKNILAVKVLDKMKRITL